MPVRVKFGLCVVLALAAIAGCLFQLWLGRPSPAYASLLLGVFFIVSLWVFPEVTRKAEPAPRGRFAGKTGSPR
jgi:hypothetical protein